ncbi:rna-directed dna polymerase from mobile element jockey- hypothetical protein [Limosa lapponica baueri]|uniref:Reverse transcriptase domain-containing protein n=1 Tax=Limosa lapponica baueri TaxID=1758121 RepID=A0A2I0UA53_LIMLA|nr:rna-directed dna polymerase from mobile element jockey- hypothetical protein [Limosa lapponica baueri]
MLDNASFSEEIFPDIHSKPPLAQLEAVSSSPVACYLEEETNSRLATPSFQGVVESEKVFPQPPFLQAEQPQLSQSLLIRLVLQTPPQFRCPSLDTLQHLNFFLVARDPELDAILEVYTCLFNGGGVLEEVIAFQLKLVARLKLLLAYSATQVRSPGEDKLSPVDMELGLVSNQYHLTKPGLGTDYMSSYAGGLEGAVIFGEAYLAVAITLTLEEAPFGLADDHWGPQSLDKALIWPRVVKCQPSWVNLREDGDELLGLILAAQLPAALAVTVETAGDAAQTKGLKAVVPRVSGLQQVQISTSIWHSSTTTVTGRGSRRLEGANATPVFKKGKKKGPDKLTKCRLDNWAVRQTKIWLKDWAQRVVISHTKSSWRPVTSGGPQGSILGLVLFNIFINYLAGGMAFTLSNFAEGIGAIQRDLNGLKNCIETNLVKFNKGKYQVLHLGRYTPMHQYMLEADQLESSSTEKDLGGGPEGQQADNDPAMHLCGKGEQSSRMP